MVISDKQIRDLLTNPPGGDLNPVRDVAVPGGDKVSGGNKNETAGGGKAVADRLTLSNRAKEAALAYSSASAPAGQERADRIRGLAKAVAGGSYRPAAGAVAGKMLGRAVADKLPE